MYLKTLTLSNFRSFDQTEIQLLSGLTVFVGENNAGKSNAIDAIRLLTKPLSDRRELYCETSDVRFRSGNQFEISGSFQDLSAPQQGRLITAAADQSLTGCIFGLLYDESSGRIPARPILWGGHQKGTPEPGCACRPS